MTRRILQAILYTPRVHLRLPEPTQKVTRISIRARAAHDPSVHLSAKITNVYFTGQSGITNVRVCPFLKDIAGTTHDSLTLLIILYNRQFNLMLTRINAV